MLATQRAKLSALQTLPEAQATLDAIVGMHLLEKHLDDARSLDTLRRVVGGFLNAKLAEYTLKLGVRTAHMATVHQTADGCVTYVGSFRQEGGPFVACLQVNDLRTVVVLTDGWWNLPHNALPTAKDPGYLCVSSHAASPPTPVQVARALGVLPA